MRGLLMFIATGARLIRRALGPLGGVVWATLPLGQFVLLPVLGYVVARVFQPPLSPWVWAVGTLAIVVLASADSGAGFSLDKLGEDLRRRGVDVRQRLAADRVRRRWAETCTQLGWDRTAAADEHTRDAGPVRPLRRPELRLVERLGDRLRVVWRPRGDQPPKQWPELVDALRRQLGAHSAVFREVPDEPGTIAAAFGLSPLPDVLHHAPTPSRAAEGRSGAEPGTFPLGARAGGGEAQWVPAESPHLLVTGATGGGKGGLIRLVVLRALELGWEPSIVDPKATGEFKWAFERGVAVAHDLEASLEQLRRAAGEVRDRCALLWEHGVDRVGMLAPELQPAPLLLVVEEAADLLLLRRVSTEKADDELRAEAGSLVSILAAQGRAAAVHLIVSIQRPDAALLGPAGGFLRSNLSGRIALGRLDPEGVDMAFGSGHRDRVVALTGQPGRALAAHLAAGEVEPYGLQAAWVDAESLRPAPVAA